MSISRLTLPSSFVDKLSDRMLMPPEPNYFWGNALYGAVMEADIKAMGGSIGVGRRDFSGSGPNAVGVAANPADLNPAGALSEAIAVERHAVGTGSTVKMNRTVFSDTTYTEASRRITRATIGTTAVDLAQEQVAITIERFGGPYTGSAVGPHVIESFDLDMSVEDLVAKVEKHLRRDRMKFVDSVLGTKACGAAPSTAYVYPGDPNFALSADNSAFLTQGDRPMDLETLIRAEQLALDNKIPTFSNGRYAAVLSPRQVRQIKTNARYQQLVAFHPDKSPIYQKYIGTIGMTDIFVSQTNPTATANSTITVQTGVLFGPGLIGYAIAKGCRAEPDDNTNFGQRVMVVWQADEGYVVLDNRFAVSLRSD